MKVLLLNPPSKKLVLRDYYCSTFSKASYLWHPIDLLAQTGRLWGRHEVKVLDAVAQRTPLTEAEKAIADFRPDVVLSLTSAGTWREDFAFLERLKEKNKFKIFMSGEIFLEDAKAILEKHEFIDGALLSFIEEDFLKFLESDFTPNPAEIKNAVWRERNKIEVRITKTKGEFSIPPMRHELFPLRRYRMPWQRYHPFATLLTDYGCPFGCKFCNSRSIGYATRRIEDIEEELEHIKSLGIRQLFIKDMTFGASRKHAVEVLELMVRKNYGFAWHGYTRADVVDEELVALMKRSGCHLLQIGVESANEKLLEDYGKNITVEKTLRTFQLLRKYGISVGAHFIIGLPGDTLEGIRKTVELAIALNPVYASFNLAMPRLGAKLPSEGWENIPLDSSGDKPFYKLGNISQEDLILQRKWALRKFYLRPSYFKVVLSSIRTPNQFFDLFRQAIGFMKNSVFGRSCVEKL